MTTQLQVTACLSEMAAISARAQMPYVYDQLGDTEQQRAKERALCGLVAAGVNDLLYRLLDTEARLCAFAPSGRRVGRPTLSLVHELLVDVHEDSAVAGGEAGV